MKRGFLHYAVWTPILLFGLVTTGHVAPDFCGTNSLPADQSTSNTPFYLRWDTPKVTAGITIAPEVRNQSEEYFQKLLSRAAGLWNEKIGSTVSIDWERQSSNAMIKVLVLPEGALPQGIQGMTTTYYGMYSHTIRRVEIRINGEQTDDQIVLTAVHEIGHALGVQGHSTISGDAMSENPNLPVRISPHDVEIAQRAYFGTKPTGVQVAEGQH